MTTLLAGLIKNQAAGRWLHIFNILTPELERAVLKPGRHIGCPIHGGKDGFKLFRDAGYSGGGICNTCGAKADGFALLMWLRGWSFPDTLSAVADVLGISNDPGHSNPIVVSEPLLNQTKSVADDERIKRVLRTVWRQSKSLQHPDASPVRRYLRFRGLDDAIPDYPSLRFHPGMQYRDEDGKIAGHYPALLALLENNQGVVTLHRTYLTRDGRKAPVGSPRKMMPAPSDKNIAGSAIRLGRPGRVLCVTEGLETALAVIEATGMVTWPLLSATMMASFLIPTGVEKLVIWSDLDRSLAGTLAATKLAGLANAQGVEAVVCEPKGVIPAEAKSIDWLDVLNQQGPNAFAFRS